MPSIAEDELSRQACGNSNYGAVPLRRAGTPEEAAAVVAFLASDEASYVIGALYVVDGGLLVRDPWT